MKWMCHGLSWRNPIDNRFSPHAFHLDKKVEVFAAEGSPDHRQIHLSTLSPDYRPSAFSSPLETDHNLRGGGGGGNIRGSFHHTITTGREDEMDVPWAVLAKYAHMILCVQLFEMVLERQL